tara:strand:+ start:152 stop:412 length:261 start_codon:yes stop_codon:yes gene_type:complete
METKYTKYTNTFPQNKKKVYFPREDYKMLQNYCILLDYPMGENYRRRDTQQGMRMKKRMKVKNNVNMRKRHRIQQPGFDVQRRGHK